jgi:hypothetical protein
MRPVIYQGDFYLIDGPEGRDMIPADVCGELPMPVDPEDPSAAESRAILRVARDYMENDEVYSIELQSGFYGRYSAPGYMDATDWTWGDSAEEVQAELERMYGEDAE